MLRLDTFLVTLPSASRGMFQTTSPENAFVFHFNISDDGIVFSEFVFVRTPPPRPRPGLFGLVCFGLKELRENLGKGSASWAPIQIADPGPVIQVLAFFFFLAPMLPAVVQIRFKHTTGGNHDERC